jgi:membrane protein YqaA with SNARE-associated domain
MIISGSITMTPVATIGSVIGSAIGSAIGSVIGSAICKFIIVDCGYMNIYYSCFY